jgi:hypothetical protein
MKEVAQNKAGPAIDTYATATTHYVQAGGTRYAYRRMGRNSGVPLIFMQNFRQGMDNIDPLLLDGFAQDRPVIIFDNTPVSRAPAVRRRIPWTRWPMMLLRL